MKIVKKGWIGKTWSTPNFIYQGEWNVQVDIMKTKGMKVDWDDDDWPPRKVTVTVEVDE